MAMRMFMLAVLIASPSCFGGTTGTEVREEHYAQIDDGMLPAELERMLGRPQGIEKDGPAEVWIYVRSKMKTRFYSSHVESTFVRFRFVEGKLQWKREAEATASRASQ